ncbi:MAG: hypothetical protein IKC09_10795, partial [Oscillospiraceae bacterium]|nr:hypothetical protein [Oscillospiraceae bacterium]
WAEDFGSEKVLKTAEYFVYCGVFKTHLWGERFAQSPKGEFLEVPFYFCQFTDSSGNDILNCVNIEREVFP